MSEWIDVSKRLPKDSFKWEHYIVTVISPRVDYKLWHEEPYDEVFVLPALYDSKQKIWQVDWGDYKEELNALITTEDSARNENVVVYWAEYPEPLEIPGTLYRGKNNKNTGHISNEIGQSSELLF